MARIRWYSRQARAVLLVSLFFGFRCLGFGAEHEASAPNFPPGLSSYDDPAGAGLWQVLRHRIDAEPFNAVATIIFFLAILHTFAAPMFLRLSHKFEAEHRNRLANRTGAPAGQPCQDEVSFKAEICHFLGEIEAVFGIWIIPLLISLSIYKGWTVAQDYLGLGLNFTEPLFVVVIMTIAASRPILQLAEQLLALAARLGRNSAAAWWLSILTFGPLLGSLITEPAAMTISALLLARRFYSRQPDSTLAYATLGALFVNVSVGGTLTHFAAPPVLMVAGKWGWGLSHMLAAFGWKAAAGIFVSNVILLFAFRKKLSALQPEPEQGMPGSTLRLPVPLWITTVHVFFLVWTVLNNHFPAMFIGGFLFYLAFVQATEHHQSEVSLRPSLLVGFFLAGLVVHGGLQGWWIQPVLSGLREVPLFFGAAVLTAFNDNAAITYLASLVPGFSDTMKHAVVAGAVVGGGLTVIANAPNPAGQSILSKYFPEGISPLHLFLGALVPTVITGAFFLVFR